VAGARRHRATAHDADVGEGSLGLLAARNAGGLPPLGRQRTTTSDPSVTARRAWGTVRGQDVGASTAAPQRDAVEVTSSLAPSIASRRS